MDKQKLKLMRDKRGRFIKGHKVFPEWEEGKIKAIKGKMGYWKGKKRKTLSWNKGLTKETDERVRINGERTGATYRKLVAEGKHKSNSKQMKELFAKKLIVHGMKGKHHTEKAKKQMSKFWKEFYKTHDGIMKGKHHTLETIKKLKEHDRIYYQTHDSPMKGRHHTLESNEKNRIAHLGKKPAKKFLEWRRNNILPKKDSFIEVKIQNFLKQLGIEFYTHQYVKIEYGYQCDIAIPVQPGIIQKTIIECDGNWWHGNLEICNRYDKKIVYYIDFPRYIQIQRIKDYERKAQLEEQGFRIIRLWEKEIRGMFIKDFQNKLLEK